MTAEYLDVEAKMTTLAYSFQSMARAPHVKLWDANSFDRWANETSLSHGELVTAQFLLTVWEPNNSWLCGTFDMMDALRVWDTPHRAAFLAWASDPWWP